MAKIKVGLENVKPDFKSGAPARSGAGRGAEGGDVGRPTVIDAFDLAIVDKGVIIWRESDRHAIMDDLGAMGSRFDDESPIHAASQ